MKVLTATTFLALFFSMPASAEALLGTWRTAEDDNGYSGLIRVQPCGDVLCGVLVQSYDDTGAPFVSEHDGRNILSETVPIGDGQYRGRAFSPDRGRTYDSRLELDGDRLRVQGCVLGICRDGGTWSRVQ